jgi:DNA-binding CsgD family transcriptional regulator
MDDLLRAYFLKHKLTMRESDVCIQITKGLSNKEIAEALKTTLDVVRYHSYNAKKKLVKDKKVASSRQLLAKVMEVKEEMMKEHQERLLLKSVTVNAVKEILKSQEEDKIKILRIENEMLK